MMNQFSPKVSEILSFSREEAERLTSRSVTPEHIMLALLREKTGPVWELFNQWKVDIDSLKKEIEKKIQEQTTDTAVPVPDMLLNEQANNILKLAVLEARLQHAQTVDTPISSLPSCTIRRTMERKRYWKTVELITTTLFPCYSNARARRRTASAWQTKTKWMRT